MEQTTDNYGEVLGRTFRLSDMCVAASYAYRASIVQYMSRLTPESKGRMLVRTVQFRRLLAISRFCIEHDLILEDTFYMHTNPRLCQWPIMPDPKPIKEIIHELNQHL